MSELRNYYSNWKNEIYECLKCNRKFKVNEMTFEAFSELMEFSCPDCDTIVLIVGSPSDDQRKEAALSGNEEAIQELEISSDLESIFLKEKLQSIDELPEIKEDNLCFSWDMIASDANEPRTVIRLGKVVIHKEIAIYEGWWRFNEIKDLLKKKYGKQFKELVPELTSETYLYGDDHRASSKISFY